jgi:hypothetical protein
MAATQQHKSWPGVTHPTAIVWSVTGLVLSQSGKHPNRQLSLFSTLHYASHDHNYHHHNTDKYLLNYKFTVTTI